MTVLEQLQALYGSRTGAVPAVLDGRPVVAHVGADVPREVLAAGGFVPFRLSGRAGAASSAEQFCGPGIDRVAVSQLARILDGDAAAATGLVISSDCEGSVRLFLYLREIQRLEPRPGVPDFTVFDLVHLRQRTSAVYSRSRLDALLDEVGAWAGRPITDEQLRAAAAAQDRVRTLIRAIGTRLRACDGGPKLTGAQALAVIGASFVVAAERWCALAEHLLDEAAALPPVGGTRVFLTGCSHDSPHVYDQLESLGAVVVGEDHDWGALAGEGAVGEAHDIRSALVRSRAQGAPASAGHAAEVRAEQTARMAAACRADLVVAWARAYDDAPAWDVPAQRRALERVGIPLLAVPAQPYGVDVSGPVRDLLRDAVRGRGVPTGVAAR